MLNVTYKFCLQINKIEIPSSIKHKNYNSYYFPAIMVYVIECGSFRGALKHNRSLEVVVRGLVFVAHPLHTLHS